MVMWTTAKSVKSFFSDLTANNKPANAGFNSSCSLRGITLTNQLRSYAQFNSFTVQGRINHAEIVDSKNGKFLAVTVITNALNDDEGMTVTFNNSNGLLALFEKGFLPTGRQVTVSGHIAYVRETYTNSDGEVQLLKRPNIHLIDASIPTGGLGALPADKSEKTVRRVGTVVRPAQATAKAAAAELDTTPVF